jgi:hypothetical protein
MIFSFLSSDGHISFICRKLEKRQLLAYRVSEENRAKPDNVSTSRKRGIAVAVLKSLRQIQKLLVFSG